MKSFDTIKTFRKTCQGKKTDLGFKWVYYDLFLLLRQ
jgi:hypothetical protein